METKPATDIRLLLTVLAAIVLIAAVSTCSNRAQRIEEPPEEPPDVIAETEPEEEEPVIEVVIPPYCTCQIPTGTLAEQNTVQIGEINSQTPRDTFVVGTPPMLGDFIYGWGSNSYDESIKTLTGGYKDTYYTTPGGQIRLNESVICQLDTEYDDQWNKTYTFTLHSYLRWSNGEPLTARDYVAGILTYASYVFGTRGGETDTGYGIVGFDTYSTGTVAPYFEGIHLIDDYTFSATISAGVLPYFWETSYVIFKPIYMEGWYPGNEIQTNEFGSRFLYSIGDDLDRIYETQRSAPDVTCGPYKFISYDGSTVRLERNEYFGVCYDGYTPYFDYIEQTVIPQDRAVEMLWAGEIDYAPDIDRQIVEKYRSGELPAARETDDDTVIAGSDPQSPDALPNQNDLENPGDTAPPQPIPPENYVKTHTYPRAGYGFLEYALDFGPTQNYNVRLAIAHIIDREILIDRAFGAEALTVDGAYSPAQWTYQMRQDELERLLMQKTYSPEEANRLLDETRWVFEEDGETPFDVEQTSIDSLYLRHNSNGEVLQIAAATGSEEMAEALEAAVRMNASLAGIKFSIEVIDMPTLLEHYYYGKEMPEEERRWNAFHLALDFTPVDDKYWAYHSSLAETPLNSNGVSDEQLDEILMAMRTLESAQTEQHADLWTLFQVRRQELLPAFPLYINRITDGMNTVITQVPATAFAPYQDVIMYIAKYE